MKKKNMVLIVLIAALFWSIKSCRYRLNCDSSDNVYLGKTDYSEKFKKFNIEQDQDTLYFKGKTGEFTFIREINPNQKPLRYNDYIVCEKIDLYSGRAYGYYEYENLQSNFRLSGILEVSPDMRKVEDKKGESLYLTFNVADVGSLKARIPISNIDTTKTYTPYGELFTYHEQVELENEILKNIWIFRRGKSALYYSMHSGIVAFEGNDRIFFRDSFKRTSLSLKSE